MIKLGGKEVKPVCYKNNIGETVDYELIGSRGAVWQVIKHRNSNSYFIRNQNWNIVALKGNYTLSNADGYLNYT